MTELVQARRVQWFGGECSEQKGGGAVRRVAIVGLLPEGLSVFERVLAEAAASTACRWAIDLYEPHPVPGAGAFYDPSQPHFLRTDQTAEQVSLWETSCGHPSPWVVHSDAGVPPVVEPQSLSQWAEMRGYRIGAGECVPRALVGRYLHETFCRLCRAAPPHVTLTLTPHRVDGIRREGRQWIIAQRHVASRGRRRQHLPIPVGQTGHAYDQVFVTTPEQPRRYDTSLDLWHRHAWTAGHAVIDRVYPTRERLSLAEVPPRRSVAVRGLDAAAIDAILALTEGRGGLFVGAGGPERHARRYLRSWREPSRVCLFSVDGRLPSPRPLPAVESGHADGSDAEVAALWQRSRATLADGPAAVGAASLWHDFLPVLIDATVARWRLSRGQRPSAEQLRKAADQCTRRLYALAAGRRPATLGRLSGRATDVSKQVERWRQEARVAWGEEPLTLRAASAQAWRQLAPHWVRAASLGRLAAGEAEALRRLHRAFARSACGPAVESVSRLLALIDAGLVDLTFYRSPRVTIDAAGFHLHAGDAQTTCRTLIATPMAASHEPLPSRLMLRTADDGCFIVVPCDQVPQHAASAIGPLPSFPAS